MFPLNFLAYITEDHKKLLTLHQSSSMTLRRTGLKTYRSFNECLNFRLLIRYLVIYISKFKQLLILYKEFRKSSITICFTLEVIKHHWLYLLRTLWITSLIKDLWTSDYTFNFLSVNSHLDIGTLTSNLTAESYC